MEKLKKAAHKHIYYSKTSPNKIFVSRKKIMLAENHVISSIKISISMIRSYYYARFYVRKMYIPKTSS